MFSALHVRVQGQMSFLPAQTALSLTLIPRYSLNPVIFTVIEPQWVKSALPRSKERRDDISGSAAKLAR